VATALFGKSGQDLIQLLDGGGDAIRQSAEDAERFGNALSSVDAAAVAAANDEWDRATAAMEGAFKVITVDLAPVIEKTANVLAEAAVVAREFAESMGGAFGILEKGLTTISPKLGLLVSVLRQTGVLSSDAGVNPSMKPKPAGNDGASLGGDLEQTWDAADVLDFVGQIDNAKQKAVKEIKSERMRVRTADEIISSLGLETKEDVQPKEHRFASAMLRGSSADYQARMMNRGNDPAAESAKTQKEMLTEAKKNNALLNDIERKLPSVGVDVVEIA
jgi:hypothetical protein